MHKVILLNGYIEDKQVTDDYVYRIIMNHRDNNYSDIIKKDYRPSVFETLTDRCAAEFGWYDFEDNSNVLEVGAGWGSFTGTLSFKCGNVTAIEKNLYKAQAICKRHENNDNLMVYAGDWHYLQGEGLYDYVIFHDVETYGQEGDGGELSSLVKELCAFLKPGGTLLLNIANKYAVKYLCGEPRGLIQPELPSLSDNSRANGLSKKEIERELSQVEGICYKFYYPLNDRYKPQQIFTDVHLPEKKVLKEVEFYRRNKNVMLSDEREVYADFMEDSIFPLFAVSFMVECTREKGQLSNINYAKISADRPRDLAMATVMTDKKVVKMPLFEEGCSHMQDMMIYQKDLQNHGISVVPMAYSNNMLIMPFVKQKRLGEYLESVVKTDKKAFIDCLDRIYSLICSSSEHIATEESFFCQKYGEAEWGPILKYAYLELIDLNCFYDGEFLFFDQEYMHEAMPAKYIMYRELLNLYYAHPEIEMYIKQADMFAHFELDNLLDIFWKEEHEIFLAKFVDRESYLRFMQPHDVISLQQEHRKQREARRETYLFSGCITKTLVVIGCGVRFKRYMSQYGKRFTPDILVDNNSDRWGENVCGVLVSSPQTLTEIDPQQLHIIICIKDFEAIEAQLLGMKIYNYRIF